MTPDPNAGAPPPPASGTPPATATPDYYAPQDQVSAAYQQYLGRPMNADEYQYWAGNANFSNEIANSPEAQAYRARNGNQGSGSPAPPSPPPIAQNTPVFSDPATAEWERNLRAMVDRLNQPQQAPDYGALIEQMRNAVSRYTTPADNPDFQPYVDYMRKYFAQLQGPAYTPAQQDLIQTQALDPLERQKQSARQQVIQRLAAQGISPSSGIMEKALQAVDTQFAQLETQSRAGFATNAINLERQNAAQAGQVGGAISGAQQQNTTFNDQRFNQGLNLQKSLVDTENQFANTNEQRAMQAIQLLFQLPQLADTRLGLANQTLQGGSPSQMSGLFGNLAQFGQLGNQQSAQDQQYWAQIGAALAHLFGLG